MKKSMSQVEETDIDRHRFKKKFNNETTMGYSILLMLILSCTMVTADQIENDTHSASDDEKSTQEEKSKTLVNFEQDFKHLNRAIAKIDQLSEQTRLNKLKLEEAKENYGKAMKNLDTVIEIKQLIDNIQDNHDCYVTYYRIMDLENKIKNDGSEINIKIYNNIRKPLSDFFAECKNIDLDLFEKYKD